MKPYSDRVLEAAPKGRVVDEADFVVIGTGPSGATAAKVLSEAGHDVIMIEEGRWIKTEEFDGRTFTVQKLCFRDMGTLAALGRSVIPLIQGRCVGGGSVINAAIIWRLPEDVFRRWEDEFALKDTVTWPELTAAFDVIEKDLNVKPVSPGVLGRNNSLLKDGADKLGLESRIIPRNERGCKGYSQCLTGCPVKAKQSMDLTYVPQALDRGARLYASCQAAHIDVEHGRASAVHGNFKDPLTRRQKGRLVAYARKGVVVCATPIQTPLLLWRSGIGLTSGHLGKHLMGHPGASIGGIYPDEVRMWEGATQGWDSEHFRKSDGIKFEALAMGPDLGVARMPGSGQALKTAAKDYQRLVDVGCALVSETEGTVRPLGDSPMVSYSVSKQGAARLRKGLAILAEIMAASGAVEILPGIRGLPDRLQPSEIDIIKNAPADPRNYTMMMTHLFGTCRMSPDPKAGVVGLDFQTHDTRGVYVLDSSIFPTNLGVNPQHTIMGIAMAGARRIAASQEG